MFHRGGENLTSAILQHETHGHAQVPMTPTCFNLQINNLGKPTIMMAKTNAFGTHWLSTHHICPSPRRRSSCCTKGSSPIKHFVTHNGTMMMLFEIQPIIIATTWYLLGTVILSWPWQSSCVVFGCSRTYPGFNKPIKLSEAMQQ